ncbi:hypothetical protein SNEBB_008929 [Seison nebaliae]|nr:hypothetical protein SNEBB_008929 [Seison nebaliae]
MDNEEKEELKIYLPTPRIMLNEMNEKLKDFRFIYHFPIDASDMLLDYRDISIKTKKLLIETKYLKKEIQLSHGNDCWSIFLTFRELIQLNSYLNKFFETIFPKTIYSITFYENINRIDKLSSYFLPSINSRTSTNNIDGNYERRVHKYYTTIPKMGMKMDNTINLNIEKYLNEILNCLFYQKCSVLLNFLEIHPFQFINFDDELTKSHQKVNEQILRSFIRNSSYRKLVTDLSHFNDTMKYHVRLDNKKKSIKSFFSSTPTTLLPSSLNKLDLIIQSMNDENYRLMIIKNSFVAFFKYRTQIKLSSVYCIDDTFQLVKPHQSKSFELITNQNKCSLSIFSALNKKINNQHNIYNFLPKTISTSLTQMIGRRSDKKAEANTNESFAPERPVNCVSFMKSNSQYFSLLADGLLNAKSEVFICDWFLSPTILLKRPNFPPEKSNYSIDENDEVFHCNRIYSDELSIANYQRYQLKNILKDIAEKGVRINIIVYNPPNYYIDLGSQQTINELKNLHENIRVFGHILRYDNNLFSFHEKMVVIDQQLLFMGGLDLAIGRWDNEHFPLGDQQRLVFGSVSKNKMKSKVSKLTVNHIQPPFIQKILRQVSENKLSSPIEPELLLSKAGMKDKPISIESISLLKLTKYSIRNIRNSHKKLVRCRSHTADYSTERKKEPLPFAVDGNASELKETQSQPSSTIPEHLFIENIYYDIINRENIPRMPWRDQTIIVYGPVVRDASIYFIKKWNHLCKAKKIPNQLLIPKTYGKYLNFDRLCLKKKKLDLKSIENYYKRKLFHHFEIVMKNYLNSDNLPTYLSECQFLCSASNWSMNLKKRECSINNSIENCIRKAKKFIYIENQFFSPTQTKIVKELVGRVQLAFERNESFHIYILLPLLPSFNQLSHIRSITSIQYDQIITKLSDKIDQITKGKKNDYLSIYSLHTWDILGKKLSHENIFVHSKLLLVDDCYAIVGSANMNDRSLVGDRDAEVAIQLTFPSDINNENTSTTLGNVVGEWRRNIFIELFDLNSNEQKKYLESIDEFETIQFFREISRNNEKFYSEIFFMPIMDENDKKETLILNHLRFLRTIHEINGLTALKKLKRHIKGLVIPHSSKFLHNQPISRSKASKLPMEFWS